MRILVFSILASLSASAFASDPECTKEPKAKWKDKAAFEKELQGQGYKIKKFKVTKTNCYEIYGHDKEGKKVEIYFNPVTGDKVKEEID
jgi:hypothetical protein